MTRDEIDTTTSFFDVMSRQDLSDTRQQQREQMAEQDFQILAQADTIATLFVNQ
jgi:hypothetical protein